ncbi:ShlB/FhaC/HecB family hemolysin secretion/activation protein [Pseudomonas carnis]|uniref:ShlB/FhaC/HecB family hemolysin secretion/activation protein n=1 Tax=Pseudomonas carnis TaxID=2487355 RepID=UPI001CA697D8|nr:ShlB/FhaC/HecB family hemolysin secretion/activation protein [Pseudomonas carnis]MBY8954202.1 ShlB/FhaC/HecB family hemolysin secretion/activation protein [Pseudomonas carnis]
MKSTPGTLGFHACIATIVCATTLWLLTAIQIARAASPIDIITSTQRLQDHQLKSLQAQALGKPDALTATPLPFANALKLPEESPCFVIRTVGWKGADDFDWLERAPAILGHCVGGEGLTIYRRWVAAQLMARGYITTQVLISAQDLSSGHLIVQLIPGRVGKIDEQPQSLGWPGMAFPAAKGELLNVRDLDQALENVRRLPGQAATTLNLIPGADLGESDVIIQQPPQARRVFGLLTVDNSGIDATGRHQLGTIVAIDSPAGLYDQLLLTYSTDTDFNNHTRGSSAKSLAWNVPAGYALLSFSASEWTSKQALFEDLGGRSIAFSSRTRRVDAGLDYVVSRSNRSKSVINARLVNREDRAWVASTELQQLHRQITSYELGLTHRANLRFGKLTAQAGVRGSLPGLSKTPGALYEQQDWNGRYHLFTAKAAFEIPFDLGAMRLGYHNTLVYQYAPVPVPSTEYMQIGGRYSVRGFDGNTTLAGPTGWTLRNELSIPTFSGSQAYAAFDAGAVSPVGGQRRGRQPLIGAAVGLRGNVSRFGYDLALGMPIKSTDEMNTATPTVDFSLSSRF